MRIKSRVNPLKILLLLFLVLTMIFIPNAFATKGGGETNIEGSDTGHASLTGIVGGWSDIKCGYRIYIVNQSNTTKSPVLDIWFTNDLYTDGERIGSNNTRAGSGLEL